MFSRKTLFNRKNNAKERKKTTTLFLLPKNIYLQITVQNFFIKSISLKREGNDKKLYVTHFLLLNIMFYEFMFKGFTITSNHRKFIGILEN